MTLSSVRLPHNRWTAIVTESVKGGFRQRDDAATEGANREDAQNADRHPSGELFDQDRFLEGPRTAKGTALSANVMLKVIARTARM